MDIPRLAAVFLAVVVTASPAQARGCLPQVHDGWLRLPPGGMPMLAGFGVLRNACPKSATIVRAESDAFADVSLHETRLEDGVSRMRAVERLPVGPRADAVLKPGGLHLMLMRPNRALKVGDVVEVRFVLQDGRRVTGRFPVRSMQGT